MDTKAASGYITGKPGINARANQPDSSYLYTPSENFHLTGIVNSLKQNEK